MTLLEWMSFIEKVIGHIMWPIATIAIVAMFKGEIAVFLKRIKKATYKGVEFDLREELQELKSDAEAAGVTIHYSKDSFKELDFESLDKAPEWAFMQSWNAIETTIRQHFVIETGSATRPTRLLVSELRRQEKINEHLFKLINNLNDIRNEVAHQADLQISRGEMIEWLGIAKSVKDRLEQNLN